MYENTTANVFAKALDFVKMTRSIRIDQRVNTDGYLVDLPAPAEELLTVAIDDTANTVFQTGIARIFCHTCTFTVPVFYIHEIMKGTDNNLQVICSIPVVRYFLNPALW
jgi:hypothetical protein